MKKVINITLGGVVFAIEQDGYDALASYLQRIEVTLTNNDDAKEVIKDIEGAIAEKFIARKRSEKQAVTVADVESIMSELGSPTEFGDDEVVSEPRNSEHATKADEPKKRLYRDSDNVVIAGVASGVAQYFDIDPVIVRLVFVVSVFFNGLGILAYIILWLVVPVAATTADKFAMRGERVTLKDISERVKEGVEHIDLLDQETARGVWVRLRRLLDKCFRVFGVLIKALLVVCQYFVGLLFVLGGALAIAGLVATYSVILLSEKVFFPNSVQIALDTLQHSAIGIVAMGSSFVMMVIPFILLVMAGASLLAKRNFFTTQKSVSLAVVWIVAAVVAGTTSALQVEQVMQKIGPVEGHFYDNSFRVQWQDGGIYGDDTHIQIRYDDGTNGVINIDPVPPLQPEPPTTDSAAVGE